VPGVEAELAAALEAELAAVPAAALQAAAARLTAAYRGDGRPGEVLTTPLAARAYAAYRMPATFAAVRAALRAVDWPEPPRSVLDLGGGTGAAVWAVADVLPSVGTVTVVDGSATAAELGRALAARGPEPVRSARWEVARLGGPVPAADLVTLAYVLGELPDPDRVLAGVHAPAVAVIEPGTPRGYQRVLAARAALVDRGYSILAPCPHDLTCPWAGTADWCHFAARLPRSARHRQVKGGTLGWEDEKFAYVVAANCPARRAPGRVVRHPLTRKGLVELAVCTVPPGIAPVKVPRSRPDYRAARDAGWGDPWPPSN
jgi:ribosomal protein RSM22 (predicted rRNA methylase)